MTQAQEKTNKYMCVFVSDIPTFISYSQYGVVSGFERLLKKVDKDDYNKIMDILKTSITKKEQELDVMDLDTDAPEAKERQTEIDELKMHVNKTQLTKEEFMKETLGKQQVEKIIDSKFTTETKKRNLTKLINQTDFKEEIKKDLKQKVQTLVNTDHGNKEETQVLDNFKELTKTNLDESQKFHRKYVFTIETDNCNYLVSIGGKMDGIDHDNKKVIEIKNRVRRLFGMWREYEKAQLMCYLYLTNYPKGVLVERYRNRSNELELDYSEKYMDDILGRLKIFCQEFCKFIERPLQEKQEFYSQTERDKEDHILDILDTVNQIYNESKDTELDTESEAEMKEYNSDISSCLLSDASI